MGFIRLSDVTTYRMRNKMHCDTCKIILKFRGPIDMIHAYYSSFQIGFVDCNI